MRYQEWWFTELPKQFRKAGFYVLTLGEDYAKQLESETGDLEMFSPIDKAIDFETAQINEYMNLRLQDDDILFLADISFPGFFTNALYHKRPKRCFAFCHATSKNNYDYFAPVHYSKFPVEEAHAQMFISVFIGSDYHDMKIHWPNALITRLPFPPLKFFRGKKTFDIVSVSRPTPQKVDTDVESLVEKEFDTKVVRTEHTNWLDYYRFLSKSKVLLITSKEETFGYQVIDAVLNGCIPIAPNKFSYPELLERPYLYDNREELLKCIEEALDDGWMEVPEILCQREMEDFYKNIIEVMKG
jgi:hypothetical protein